MDFETPEADAAEQLHEAQDNTDEQEPFDAVMETPADANPADMAEQHQAVPDDESDERF